MINDTYIEESGKEERKPWCISEVSYFRFSFSLCYEKMNFVPKCIRNSRASTNTHLEVIIQGRKNSKSKVFSGWYVIGKPVEQNKRQLMKKR